MNNVEVHLEDTMEVIHEILDGGGEFRLYPRGRSMRPCIVEGRDSVVLIKKEPSAIKKHDMLLYRRANGQLVLHRLMRIEKDGTYTMCGDAQAALEKGISQEQMIGCVARLYRKQRCVSMTSFGYRVYVLIWSRILLRRCVLFVARRFHKMTRILHKKRGEN